MLQRRVSLLKSAQDDLDAIEAWLAMRASRPVAERFVDRIVDRLATLQFGAERGTLRAELAALRVIGLLPTVSVAFLVTEEAVLVYRIVYGGQNWQAALTTEDDD